MRKGLDGLISPKEWIEFQSEQEQLKFLRNCGLISAKAQKPKQFCYNGFFTPHPVICSVVGAVSKNTVVIELPTGYHCINVDHLKDMQLGMSEWIKDTLKVASIETFVAVDVETTGLSSESCRIIEIGAVKYQGQIEIDRYEVLINPGCELPGLISRLTGITDLDLDGCPCFSDVFPEFLEFIGNDPLIAHNAVFEKRFFQAEAARMGSSFDFDFIDTLKLFKQRFNYLKSHKLSALVEHFDIQSTPTHRALADAIATAELFIFYKSSLGAVPEVHHERANVTV